MATGEISEFTLAGVLGSGHEVVGLVTQPDRPVGRKQVLSPPGVKVLAQERGVEVIQPERIREEWALEKVRAWEPEVIVVMAYGQILPESLIGISSVATINLHASLLPKYRGASCIQGALRDGERETGWSVIHVVKKLDAGDVILRRGLEIGEKETGGELHDRLARLGPAVCLEALELLAKGEAEREEQDEEGVLYAPKLERRDGEIDWGLGAEELERMVRAYDPWPGTTAGIRERRLKIFPPVVVGEGEGRPGEILGLQDGGLEVGCGTGSLILGEVQMEGGRRMSVTEVWRGHREAFAEGLK